MKLNDFISEYYEMIDNPNEVLEFFKLASDYLSPDTYNKLCLNKGTKIFLKSQVFLI